MPVLLEHIVAIARKLRRDVLYLEFLRAKPPHREDHKTFESRKLILDWLDGEGIGWRECAPIASETMMRSYAGEVYLDVPFDRRNALYRKVQAFLEHPDGTMKFSDVGFYIVPLELAMKNAHHDEPGFWERWAEDF